jgi:hypothetical protein
MMAPNEGYLKTLYMQIERIIIIIIRYNNKIKISNNNNIISGVQVSYIKNIIYKLG